MDYKNFEITNFKGIEHIKIDLDRHPQGSVFTLVGLNESGKTTVLEAISYFNKRDKHLESLYDEEFRHSDVNDLVPLKKKANFNGTIEIRASISVDSADRAEMVKYAFKNFGYRLNSDKLGNHFTVTKKLNFEKSIYKSSQTTWDIELHGTPSKKRSVGRMYHQDKEVWNKMVAFVGERLPSILYFPTFLFEFPSKIYLHKDDEETITNDYYRSIVQDILDSLNDGLVIEEHIVERAIDGSHVMRRSLDTVLNKMGNIVTKTVFDRWNEVFDRRPPQKDIRINCEVEKGIKTKVYLEFQIKDGESIYLISERSLGFRWFFCFLLFTQFRAYRKSQKNTLFLFDEPASNLHSKAQMQLLESFSKITESGGKIIYSTHSHHMINPKWLENAFIVKNEGLKYEKPESDYEYSSRDTNIVVDTYRHFVGQNPDRETYFQPILDVLDYVPSKLEFVPNVVMVEGKTDYYLIKYFESVTKSSESIKILPGSGANGLDTLIALYLGWGKYFVILLDDDKAGRDAKKKYITEWLLPEDRVMTLQDVNPAWEKYVIEDLIDATDKINLKSDIYPNKPSGKISKNELCRAIQEKLLNGKYDGFSGATLQNFEDLVKKLKEAISVDSNFRI